MLCRIQATFNSGWRPRIALWTPVIRCVFRGLALHNAHCTLNTAHYSLQVYGGCEGPDAMYVKLISSDGHEFMVSRDHALTSGTAVTYTHIALDD